MERRIKRGKAKSGKETTATHWLSFKSSHLVNFYNGVNMRMLIVTEQERRPKFLRLANALSALYPRGSEEKRLLDAMLLAVPK